MLRKTLVYIYSAKIYLAGRISIELQDLPQKLRDSRFLGFPRLIGHEWIRIGAGRSIDNFLHGMANKFCYVEIQPFFTAKQALNAIDHTWLCWAISPALNYNVVEIPYPTKQIKSWGGNDQVKFLR